jgi:hypothetical protein
MAQESVEEIPLEEPKTEEYDDGVEEEGLTLDLGTENGQDEKNDDEQVPAWLETGLKGLGRPATGEGFAFLSLVACVCLK